MPIDGQMVKENVRHTRKYIIYVYIYRERERERERKRDDGILLSLKKDRNLPVCKNMGETGRQYAE